MSSEEQPGSEMNNESTSVDDGTIKNFVVGEIPCTFTEVGHVLSKSASAEKLWLKLIDVATSLEIPSGCMVSLKKRISTDTITYPSALYEILQAWQQKFTFDATLQNLVKVLQKHELNDCADELQIHFKIFDDAYAVSNLKKLKYGNEASTLKPLPDHLKSWLNNKIVKFQQHQIKLETLTAKIATEVDEKILDELCDMHPRLKEIIHSNNSTVVAVLTNSAEISVNRIRDTIAHRVQVLEEHEITQASLQSIHVLLVLKCETLTPELMKKLVCLDRLVVCICKMVDDGVQGCEILRDTQTLGDLSKLWFRIDGNLYNLTELFATPNILGQLWKPSTELTKLNIDYFFKVIGYNMGHRISTHVKYVSTNVFNYFLPDKFVFLNINEKDLRFYAKYGQKIGNSSQDIKSLDYVILPQVEKHIFEKICIESGTNVHLVEHDKGSFKMIRTWGSEDNVKKFFKPTRLCEFPSCNCPTSHLVMMIKIFYKDFSGKQEFVTCEFNVDELLPKGIQVFGVEEQIDLLELRALFNDLDKYVLELNLSGFVIVLDVLKRELLSNSIGQHVAQIVYKIVEYLVCPEEHENLQQVAVNTVFPHLAKTVQFSSQSVEKYICMGFLEDRNDLLLFKNDILAFYFIAEMIINQVDTISTNEFLSEIFCNCFNTYTNRVSFNSRDNSEYRTKPIASYKFEQIRLFKFLDVFARNQPDAVYKLLNKVISPQCYKKWIHASVNDNMVDLFKILMKLELNILECDVEDLHKNFVMWEDVVVLSIIHCDVSFVELVAQEYKNHSHLLLENIKLSCFKYDYTNNKSKFECFINVVDVAALKRECQVFEYLLNNHFNETINQPKIHDNITYLCVADTKTHDHVDERKRMMSAIFQNHTTLLQSQPNHYAILAPNIHVDLIIHVINLGIHVYATNNRNQNVLHLCAEYLTPEEYDRVVNVLVEKNHTGLFHGRDKYQNTPLHRAVKHLELCNSTFAIFHSYNVDFNAVNIYNKTPLIEAVLSQKSLRVLNSLIKIGADNKTPSFLHAAACSGNFSALKYFLVSGNGHDVNVTDKLNRYSPLHLTFLHSKKHSNANEMVVLLLQYGADVRALDKDGKTPVDIANLNFCGVQLEACTKEILEMESDFRKWLFEIGSMDSSISGRFYTLLLNKMYDFGILLRVFYQTNNKRVLRILLKEFITMLYNSVLNLNVTLVHHVMQAKGYANVLQQFLETLEGNEGQEYADKLTILQLLCKLNPKILPPKRAEMYTPLQLALLSHHEKQLEFIQVIIAHNVDVNERDSKGWTPLHYAVRQEQVPPHVKEIVKLLVDNGADPTSIPDYYGLTNRDPKGGETLDGGWTTWGSSLVQAARSIKW
ncbi:unnamed protein product [Orchesella dallaii]|uniref:Death domain-containing protein n=1 Tax=Orchesella dallaii TaxID=48710 RepID=A0ABP1R009_9HEXA